MTYSKTGPGIWAENSQKTKGGGRLRDTSIKCSLSLVIREIQTKITLRFHFTSVRMTKVKRTTDNKHWRSVGETESHPADGTANWYSHSRNKGGKFINS